MIAYTVTAEFDDPAVAQEWIAWLRDGHLAAVIAGGALDATIVQLDRDAGGGESDGPIRCEVRYHFASRESFRRYEQEHAPRLRAEGLLRFPPHRGIKMARSVGTVAAHHHGRAGNAPASQGRATT
jgi:hypothetical protein